MLVAKGEMLSRHTRCINLPISNLNGMNARETTNPRSCEEGESNVEAKIVFSAGVCTKLNVDKRQTADKLETVAKNQMERITASVRNEREKRKYVLKLFFIELRI